MHVDVVGIYITFECHKQTNTDLFADYQVEQKGLASFFASYFSHRVGCTDHSTVFVLIEMFMQFLINLHDYMNAYPRS